MYYISYFNKSDNQFRKKKKRKKLQDLEKKYEEKLTKIENYLFNKKNEDFKLKKEKDKISGGIKSGQETT